MTKAELRKIYRQKRKEISWKEREQWTDLILINFQKIELPFIECVHTYLAMEVQNEISTDTFAGYLKFLNPGLKRVVPKISFDTAEMRHYILNDDMEMIPNDFGIIEPLTGEKIMANDIDLVLTPLLAFDKMGYRVGYGKGFYDRFFGQCREETIKVGLSFFGPVESIDNIDAFDIPLNYCVTPNAVYKF